MGINRKVKRRICDNNAIPWGALKQIQKLNAEHQKKLLECQEVTIHTPGIIAPPDGMQEFSPQPVVAKVQNK
jgi:hypothetical protein